MPPVEFGKYLLHEQIAEGGMAIVYRASLPGPHGFEKPLCIKQIRPELAEKRQFLDLFIAEAKLTVTLSHANIVPVYELGRVDDIYYLALEYVDGVTLNELLQHVGALPLPMALTIVEQILRGLDYAHRRGVVHRDLSLANVLVSLDGEVRLTDFGIAQAIGSAGMAGGSKGYSAPEQELGAAADVRADVYAAGVILSELVSGERRAAGKAGERALGGLPAEIAEICARATAHDVNARYADAMTMLREVSRCLREFSIPAPTDLSQQVFAASRKKRQRDARPNADDAAAATRPRTTPKTTANMPTRVAEKTRADSVTFATRLPSLPAPAKSARRVLVAALGIILVTGGAAAIWVRNNTTEPAAGHALAAPPRPTKSIVPVPTPMIPLHIASIPTGAEVTLDGKAIGLTPATTSVPADNVVQWKLRKKGFRVVGDKLDAKECAKTGCAISRTLAPLATGTFTLGSTPWAHAVIDGELSADTPIVERALSEGPHQVVLTQATSGKQLRFTVRIVAGAQSKWLADFRDDPRVEEVRAK